MFDQAGRAFKDRILGAVARMVPLSISANMVTVLSLPLGLASAAAATQGWWTIGLFLFAANRVLDGLDGLIAHQRNSQTDFGAYLDIMVDFAVYSAIPTGIWYGVAGSTITPPVSVLPLIVLLSVFYMNAASWMYLAATLEKRRHGSTEHRRTSLVMPSGLVEGGETILFYSLFFLLPQRYALLFTVMACATAVGVLQRLIWAWRNIQNSIESRSD